MGHGADRAVRVLVVDPMPLARKALTEVLRPCADIEVVGAVSGPAGAERRLVEGGIDALLLDIEGPVTMAVDPLLRLVHLEGQGSRPKGEQYRGAALLNRHLFTLRHGAAFDRNPGAFTAAREFAPGEA